VSPRGKKTFTRAVAVLAAGTSAAVAAGSDVASASRMSASELRAHPQRLPT
jgi:hypothetical protein